MQIEKRHSGILHGVECNNFVISSLDDPKTSMLQWHARGV